MRKLGRGEEKEVKKESKRIVKRCVMTIHVPSNQGLNTELGRRVRTKRVLEQCFWVIECIKTKVICVPSDW